MHVIRLRLPESELKVFKQRAALRASGPVEYGVMVLRYLSVDRRAILLPEASSSTAGTPVHFILPTTGPQRRLFEIWSGQCQWNIASFCGELVVQYMKKFPEDPRDFFLLQSLGEVFEKRGVVDLEDLRWSLERWREETRQPLSEAYLLRWLFTRLKPLLPQIQVKRVRCTLQMEHLEQVLAPVKKG